MMRAHQQFAYRTERIRNHPPAKESSGRPRTPGNFPSRSPRECSHRRWSRDTYNNVDLISLILRAAGMRQNGQRQSNMRHLSCRLDNPKNNPNSIILTHIFGCRMTICPHYKTLFEHRMNRARSLNLSHSPRDFRADLICDQILPRARCCDTIQIEQRISVGRTFVEDTPAQMSPLVDHYLT